MTTAWEEPYYCFNYL